MKYLIILLLLISFGAQAKTLGLSNSLPTPANFCVSGYTDTIRPPTSYTNAIKRKWLISFKLPGTISDYELDHLMPLGLNGHPRDVRNLEMQPWSIARLKDVDENRLRKDVCIRHTKTLLQAQQEIASKWGK